MNNTTTPKKENLVQSWHFIDASGKTLGRLSTEVAKLLTGKDNVMFSNHINMGDKVVITNAEKITVTGNKLEDKIYYRHTGFPKGLRAESLGKLLNRRPTEVLRRSISGMLPQNKLKKERLNSLFIYEGENHPHQAQQNFKENK